MDIKNCSHARCTPRLVTQSLVGYFAPCITADPLVGGEVIGGASNLGYREALTAIARGRLPSFGGRSDRVISETREYAVQFILDCPKVLSVMAIVLADPVAVEALRRARIAIAQFIAGAVPISAIAEEMLDRKNGQVKSLVVRISEKLTRPDSGGVCYPHDHDHLIVHPHALNGCGNFVMIYRDLLLRGAPLFTDIYQQALTRTLAPCCININASCSHNARMWEEAFSIKNPGKRSKKPAFTVEQMRPKWEQVIKLQRLQPIKPLTQPLTWPSPITAEMIQETAERHNWFANPEHLAVLKTLGGRAKTFHSFGHRVVHRHDRKAGALTVESVKIESGIDLIVTVGGPKHGPLNRIAKELLTGIKLPSAALEFANMVRKDPLLVSSSFVDEANKAIRENLIQASVIGGVLGTILVADLCGGCKGSTLSEESLARFIGGFASPTVNIRGGWFRGKLRRVTGVNKCEIRCEGVNDTVNANRLEMFPARQLTLHEGDFLRLTRSIRLGRQLSKGRLVRVRAICGDEIETTGGDRIPVSILDWPFCVAEPAKGVGHLSHPFSELHRTIASWNPRIPPSIQQVASLVHINSNSSTGRTVCLRKSEGGILDLVFNACSCLHTETIKLVLGFYSAYLGVATPEFIETHQSELLMEEKNNRLPEVGKTATNHKTAIAGICQFERANEIKVDVIWLQKIRKRLECVQVGTPPLEIEDEVLLRRLNAEAEKLTADSFNRSLLRHLYIQWQGAVKLSQPVKPSPTLSSNLHSF